MALRLPVIAASFKLKLAVYFLLLSLLPAAAAFWGFSSVAQQSESRRVDARLQAGLRAALAAYEDELNEATRAATALANDPVFQTALAEGDAAAAAVLVRIAKNIRVESPAFDLGEPPGLAVERRVVVVGGQDPLGYVIAAVPLDPPLLRRLIQRSGLDEGERVIVVSDGRVALGLGAVQGRLLAMPERPTTVTLGTERYRALVASPIEQSGGPALAVVAPQSTIDDASAQTRRRLLLGLLGAVLLVALVAYIEGRSIVRSVSGIARAANAIARGRLDERVPVRGRDELARLGSSFNQMADQLQARLEELESERARLRDAIVRFGDVLAATHDTDQLLRVIAESIVEATGAGGAMLVGADGHVFEVGAPGSGSEHLELPLQARHRSFGTLFLFGRHFDEEARLTASSLASQAVIALENARLHRTVERQALVDGLTGLSNRRHAEDRLSAEIARAERFGGPLSVVVADLDDFKIVNDDRGHPVGDTVLREFARVLELSVRETDVAARWGGEEFVLVLPGTDPAGAALLAERIRSHVADRPLLTPEGLPLIVTASFGIAGFFPGISAEELVAQADLALYQAKRAGKNRVGTDPTAAARP